MKKLLCVLLILMMCSFPAAAAQQQDLDGMLQEQYQAAGTDALYGNLPSGVQEQLEQNGIDSAGAESMLQMDIGSFFVNLWDSVVDLLHQPLNMLVVCFGIMLLSALLHAFRTTVESSMSKVFTLVSLLAICGVMVPPLIQCIQYASATIQSASDFLLCFIPVFTGVVAASGMPISSLGYNTALFGAIQVVSSIISNFLLPFIGIFLALSLVSSLSGQVQISKLTGMVKKMVVWAVTLLLTLFTGLFSAQTMVAGSADAVTVKTTKFLVSSFVPVVGNAIGDAFASVQGCLGLVKSSVGAFGIIACLLTFVPPILTVAFYMLAVKIAAATGQMFQIEGTDELFQAAYDSLSILLAFLISFSILSIVCTALMIFLSGKGVG